MKTAISCFFIAVFFFLAGCGVSLSADKTPDLFINDKYNQTGESARFEDKSTCMKLADENVESPGTLWILSKYTFFGTLVGTVPGAIGGTITGDTPQSTAVGAAAGAVVGLIQGIQKIYDDNPYYQRFVEHCLHKKGYEIKGWK